MARVRERERLTSRLCARRDFRRVDELFFAVNYREEVWDIFLGKAVAVFAFGETKRGN